MEENISCKWRSKESWSHNTHIRQKDFKMKNTLRDKEGHYIMIKGSIQEEDITILNTYAPNIASPQYIRRLLTTLKGEIDNNTIIAGDFTPHLQQYTDHPTRKLTRKHRP